MASERNAFAWTALPFTVTIAMKGSLCGWRIIIGLSFSCVIITWRWWWLGWTCSRLIFIIVTIIGSASCCGCSCGRCFLFHKIMIVLNRIMDDENDWLVAKKNEFWQQINRNQANWTKVQQHKRTIFSSFAYNFEFCINNIKSKNFDSFY